MEPLLELCGLLMIGLALLHLISPPYFHWKEELARISLINRQIMIVHTFFIALTFFLMGLRCVTSADHLSRPPQQTTSADHLGRPPQQHPAGKRIPLGFGVFGAIRLVIQCVGYSPELWRGKRLETTVQVLSLLSRVTLTTVFLRTTLG
jgi:hypothetical protein